MKIVKVTCVFLFVMFLLPPFSNAEIKNGYGENIEKVIEQLQYMNAMKNCEIYQLNGEAVWENLDGGQKYIVNSKIKSLHSILEYYLLTERLIDEFKSICPDIFEEINSIKNCEAQKTDVYIKVLPANHEIREISGITIISRDPDNRNVCVSEYGKNTISIQVCATTSILKVLAHEFGHVKFVLPNLDQYIEYCKIRYHQEFADYITFNHQAADMGSRSAFEFEKRFIHAYKLYLESEGHVAINPRKLLKEIESNIKMDTYRIANNFITNRN